MGLKQLAGVQAARGVAAVLVVIHHCAGTLALPKYAGIALAGGYFVPLGRAGVDFFFVLSGFIIAWVHGADVGQREKLRGYTAKRLARIFPVYWVIFALLVLVYAVAPGLGQGHERTAASILSGLVLLPMPTPPIVGVAWTLSHELLFYALFGLCIYAAAAGRAVVCAWAAAIVAGLWWKELPYPLSFLLNVKNLEFLMGIGVAWLVRRHPAQNGRAWYGVIALGAAIFAATALLELRTMEFRHRPETLLYGLGSSLMLIGVVETELAGGLSSLPGWLRAVGDASYSIYLFHFTILVAFIKVAKSAGWFGLPQWVLACLLVTAATAIGMLIYRCIERPMTRLAQERLLLRLAPRIA